MCAFSMVVGHHQQLWPRPEDFPVQRHNELAELLRKARLYDEMMKQPDCPDPAKEQWLKDLDRYLADTYGLKKKLAPDDAPGT